MAELTKNSVKEMRLRFAGQSTARCICSIREFVFIGLTLAFPAVWERISVGTVLQWATGELSSNTGHARLRE